MERRLLALLVTARFNYGKSQQEGNGDNLLAIGEMFWHWLSPPMDGAWPPAAMTRPSCFGISPLSASRRRRRLKTRRRTSHLCGAIWDRATRHWHTARSGNSPSQVIAL